MAPAGWKKLSPHNTILQAASSVCYSDSVYTPKIYQFNKHRQRPSYDEVQIPYSSKSPITKFSVVRLLPRYIQTTR